MPSGYHAPTIQIVWIANYSCGLEARKSSCIQIEQTNHAYRSGDVRTSDISCVFIGSVVFVAGAFPVREREQAIFAPSTGMTDPIKTHCRIDSMTSIRMVASIRIFRLFLVGLSIYANIQLYYALILYRTHALNDVFLNSCALCE